MALMPANFSIANGRGVFVVTAAKDRMVECTKKRNVVTRGHAKHLEDSFDKVIVL